MGVKKEILKGVEAKKKRWTWSICAQRKLKYYSQYYCFSFKNLRKLILFKLFIVQFLLSKRKKSQKEYFLHLLDNLWRCFLRKLRMVIKKTKCETWIWFYLYFLPMLALEICLLSLDLGFTSRVGWWRFFFYFGEGQSCSQGLIAFLYKLGCW